MLLDVRGRVGEKVHQGIFYGAKNRVSGLIALANPRRIKASHRRRWKAATGSRPYANNNPYAFTDPDGRQSRREAHEERRRENFCNTGCNAGSFSSGGATNPDMFVVNNAPQYVANFYGIDASQVEFTTSEYGDCAQTMYCSVRFNAKTETAYLSYPQTGTAPAAGFRAAGALAKQLIGKGFPTKLNRAGKAQPYNPANGQYLPAAANPGLKLSPASRFSSGFAEGFNEAKGSGVPGVPIGKAGGWGYMLGYLLGQF